MIKIYYEIFGPNFINNVAFVFTHWAMSEYAEYERTKNGESED
jgi:hypothetical protein